MSDHHEHDHTHDGYEHTHQHTHDGEAHEHVHEHEKVTHSHDHEHNGEGCCHDHGDHGHGHEHTHEAGGHGHKHEHGENCSCGCHHHHEEPAEGTNKSIALLKYMLEHNEHHTEELLDMALELRDAGQDLAAGDIEAAADAFRAGNKMLEAAIRMVVVSN